MGLTKLLVVTQLTCGPNETPGRNKVFGLLPVSLMKLLVETKLCGFLPVGLTKLLVETKLCGLLLVGLTKLLVEGLSRGLGCL